MKLAIVLGVSLVVLFAGLANLWIGDITLGLWLIAAFCVAAGASALIGKRAYDARPVEPPVLE